MSGNRDFGYCEIYFRRCRRHFFEFSRKSIKNESKGKGLAVGQRSKNCIGDMQEWWLRENFLIHLICICVKCVKNFASESARGTSAANNY
jgi:hypothetical protein